MSHPTDHSAPQELLNQALKAAPPAAVVGSYLAGVSLSDWVLYGSGLLILLQIFFLLKSKLWDSRKK